MSTVEQWKVWCHTKRDPHPLRMKLYGGSNANDDDELDV